MHSDSASLISFEIDCSTASDPKYMNMGPLDYRSSAVPGLVSDAIMCTP